MTKMRRISGCIAHAKLQVRYFECLIPLLTLASTRLALPTLEIKKFACLGLVKQNVANPVLLDYSQAPVAVFIGVASYLLKDQGRVDLLVHTSQQMINVESILSWVPDWSSKSLNRQLPAQFTTSLIPPSSWYPKPSLGARQLPENLQRLLLGSVNDRDTQFTLEIGPREIRTQRSSTVSTLPCLKFCAHYLDTIVSLESRPLVIGDIRHKDVPPAYGLTGCIRCAGNDVISLHQTYVHMWDKSDRLFGRSTSGRTQYYRDAAWDWINDTNNSLKEAYNRLKGEKISFLTDQSEGYARTGDSQRELQSGDSIWALAGLNVPMILRQVDDHYVLIKECYLLRATERHMCLVCGGTEPWPMFTKIIDIW